MINFHHAVIHSNLCFLWVFYKSHNYFNSRLRLSARTSTRILLLLILHSTILSTFTFHNYCSYECLFIVHLQFWGNFRDKIVFLLAILSFVGKLSVYFARTWLPKAFLRIPIYWFYSVSRHPFEARGLRPLLGTRTKHL